MALAAISFVSTSASAQNINSVGTTDLILGFEVTDGQGTGASNILEVDLGAASQFTTTANDLAFSQVTNADLKAAFGSNWASLTDLSWGVAGQTSGSYTMDVTDTLTPQTLSSTPAKTVYAQIGYFANQSTLLPTVTPESDTKAAAQLTAGTGAFNAYNIGESTDFGYLTHKSTIYNNQNNTVDALGNLNLWSVASGSKTELGTFTLSDTNGVESFVYNGVTPAATPEPSTYALMLGGLLLLVVLKRRNLMA